MVESLFFIKLQSTSSEHVEPASLKHINEVVLVQLLTDAVYPLGQLGIPLLQSTNGQLCPPLEEEAPEDEEELPPEELPELVEELPELELGHVAVIVALPDQFVEQT